MTPPAVLVLVAGVLLVLAVAAVALLLDARRRAGPPRRAHRRAPWPRGTTPPGGSTPPRDAPPARESAPPRDATSPDRPTPQAGASPSTGADPQTDPIDTAVAREDPPTIAAPGPVRSRRPDDPPRPPGPRSGGPSVRASLPDEVRNRPRALPVPVVQAVFHPRPHNRNL